MNTEAEDSQKWAFLFLMHYINIANGYLARRLYVWKAKHWETEYIEHFPNHFQGGPWPCHMLGGCRSSLETSAQHDGWHALTGTLGHLIFLSEFLGQFLLKFIHENQNCNMKARFALLWKMLQSVSWRPGWGDHEVWENLYLSLFSGNLLKRSTDGWEGNLNVISWRLPLGSTKSNVPAQYNGKEKSLTVPLAKRFDPILW